MKKYKGIWPVVPTVFDDQGNLDLEGQKRTLDFLIDQKVDGACILANYSEQFSLSDDERNLLQKVCINHVAGRMPLIVTISHFSTKIACERAKSALAEGASIVMAMPPYHGALLKGSPNQILDHFKEMGDVGIPIMLQDAPLSGVPLPVPLLAELAKNIEMLQLFKIESTGAAEKIHNLLKLADQHIEGPFDGEEGITLYADLEAGATGSMTSALIPDLVRPVITSFLTGSKSTAREQYGAVLPIINHENRQCGFRATKEAMVEGGIIKSSYCRHPIERLRPQARDMLMELLKIHDPAVLSWGK
ncbi:MAG: dihydrodipicolinate synthase family protein [Paracoccaceae bacterium]|nr:dihydrodipicolinate synthase family protein [Paracoccaceae bacterium]MXZ50618.1 dihydrodipicolinate synthase family protein [Paracoccaceae bacterium]MYF45162.1 dihydrodipicolinate synthase family protein [Paracoccaceae bacterium]MYG10640.1 dihydrodipicolinate synthase family protein [Paracoccaceae bacterium]MYI91337.1 dihydrodipicolinate synthase family protein [Paracoccaceae bacterium]